MVPDKLSFHPPPTFAADGHDLDIKFCLLVTFVC